MDEPHVHHRKQSIGRASAINLFGQALPLLAGVFAIPALIEQIGTARFGWLALMWAACAYFALFDIGLGRSTTRAVAGVVAMGRVQDVTHIVWSATVAQLATGVAAAGVAAIIATPLSHAVLADSQLLRVEARNAFLVLALSVPAVTISSSWRGVLEAHGRFDLVNSVRSPLTASFFLIPLLIGAIDSSLVAISAGLAAVQVAALVAYVLLARRVQPLLKRVVRPSREEAKKLLRFGGWLTVSDLVAPILVYSDRFLLGVASSATRITYYTAPFDVVTRLWVIPNSLVSALFPALTQRAVAGAAESVKASARRGTRYVAAIVGWIAAIIAADADGILRLWLGESFARESANVLRFLAIAIVINSVAQVAHTVILAYSRSDISARFHLLEVPVHLVLVTLFIRWWGVEGAAAAWLVRVSIDACLMFAAATKLVGNKAFALIDLRLGIVMATAGTTGIVLAASGVHLLNPGFSLIALVGLVAMWFAAVEPLERSRAFGAVARYWSAAE